MSTEPNSDKNGLRKQAFYDSHTSYKVNIDKFKNISDPILQQKDKYVSNKIFNQIISLLNSIENKRMQNPYRIKELLYINEFSKE